MDFPLSGQMLRDGAYPLPNFSPSSQRQLYDRHPSNHVALPGLSISTQSQHVSFGMPNDMFLQDSFAIPSRLPTPLLSEPLFQTQSSITIPRLGLPGSPLPGRSPPGVSTQLAEDGDFLLAQFIDFPDEELLQFEDIQAQTAELLPSAPRIRTSNQEWHRHKDKIKKHYLDEGNSISQTRKILKDLYDFDVPERALKNKVQEWNFNKNIRRDMALWMYQQARLRKEEHHKRTKFLLGRQEFTLGRVERSLKRMKVEPSTMHLNHILQTPPGVRCVTPSVASTLSSPAPRTVNLVPMGPPRLPPPSSQHHRRSEVNQIPSIHEVFGTVSAILHPSIAEVDIADLDSTHVVRSAEDEDVDMGLAILRDSVAPSDHSSESTLLRLLDVDDASISKQQCYVAASTWLDNQVSRSSLIPRSTLLPLVSKAEQLLGARSTMEPDDFAALFAFAGRVLLYEQHDNPVKFVTKLCCAAESVLICAQDDMICLLFVLGRLLEEHSWDSAKTYFGRALSLALGSEQHEDCQAEQILRRTLDGSLGELTGKHTMRRRVDSCALGSRLGNLCQGDLEPEVFDDFF